MEYAPLDRYRNWNNSPPPKPPIRDRTDGNDTKCYSDWPPVKRPANREVHPG